MLTHLDLFSGIGGFAYAAQQVWGDEYECAGFCEIDPYCQALLKLRFPEVKIYGDIRGVGLDTNSDSDRSRSRASTGEVIANGSENIKQGDDPQQKSCRCVDLVTGGFPCQPFSQAGKRRGTQDNRFLWPEMLRVIKDFKPRWVVAENVRGLLTIEGGVVFESCLSDLEAAGYQTQAFIIPACSVNAPHRRDRVWIVGHSKSTRQQSGVNGQRKVQYGGAGATGTKQWQQNWLEVATRLCGVDDGLSAELDGLELSKSKHRVERLKSLGNSIVPQVAMEIFKTIKLVDLMERL